ncbi:bifunctional cystathionine gamma-lyase/homocysteine desulfhydrase [Macrococcoides caseolyticum subsp. caseolyticum]|uniref:bifunctional cystathionine gamma-lyase/homocysteine desulfhydrase n=1 Tax=Macrococcoides caseolyticum TaxID=69966 RepID=UPI000CD122D7|nr:bifunctional cystathionine gamma-lyase/homocysteine desulfhydrase [Macrococcus caseolyticus]PNZ75143.1 cystathionine gamma-synthase [Macrococcus caseolyticus]QPT46176.1 bifunctional cystathionine gamma-lyase/homocysteine desulfhydrase [Macrococcus caseolyticus]QQB04701.1 bifunctional cystathionine gamma-lyase/homocysteine desulfhydrase [Macrococcus caseolyticus]RAK45365.1 bifunctional cystathionine gamma-lyase/homocysteine desulfhydrase [Macrococcus caseolyticus subsp. caseolyticus]TDM27026
MQKKTMMIHGGNTIDEYTGAVNPPIYQTSTYKQDGIGNMRQGYEYSRSANPTRTALESLIRDLESGDAGFAFGSGMAAISSVIMLLNAGDHIVVGSDVYGGTYRVFTKVFERIGIKSTFVDTTDIEAVEAAISENTKMLYIETPTNPLLNVTDIRKMVEISKAHNLISVVDNTFMTPYFQNPLELGADIVLHSATKYIGGHSDVVAGLVVTRTPELSEAVGFIQNSVGGVLGPQDSFLLVRGIKTLAIRMEQTEQTTLKIIEFLKKQNVVTNIFHPSLLDEGNKKIHESQSKGYGGMISFDVGSKENAENLVKSTKYFTLAESLGAVESLISVPSQMTHASIPRERRLELGITDGLVRISVGIEDSEDLIADLEQAFKQLN